MQLFAELRGNELLAFGLNNVSRKVFSELLIDTRSKADDAVLSCMADIKSNQHSACVLSGVKLEVI